MAENTKSTDATKAVGTRWWVDEGEEDCPHCGQTYFYEVEARCLECDAPICPMCIVRVEQHPVCPDCQEAAT
jgi:hypothetical protein